MGNQCTCFSLSPPKKPTKKTRPPSRPQPSSASGASNPWAARVRSLRKHGGGDGSLDLSVEEQQQRALAAAAILFGQQNGLSLERRSSSLRYPNNGSRSNRKYASGPNQLPRSSSSRSRSLTDPLLQPHHLGNQDDITLDDLESNHFVLVHGGGFGAWCWYKTMALLDEAGFKVTAIDLTGSGIQITDTNRITSLSQYVKPLTDFLEKLINSEKVILVGHDFGGACISFAMELFPRRISKAIFVAAAMLTNGQSTLDMFSQQAGSNDLMQKAQTFVYAKGNNKPPTSIDLDRTFLKELLFNQSPTKDVALASVSMRPIPFAPILEKLSLSDMKYGSIRRFYIQTLDDNAIPDTIQENMIDASPPEKVFCIKGADHSPFFSKPQALHKLLVEISKIS